MRISTEIKKKIKRTKEILEQGIVTAHTHTHTHTHNWRGSTAEFSIRRKTQ